MTKRHYLQLILYKTYSDLRVESQRGYIGFLWWVLEPLLYMGAFYIVFGVIFQRDKPGFVGFLLTGLVVWKWFDSSLRMASNSITANRGLMMQVALPKWLFPVIVVCTTLFKFLIVFLLLVIFMLFTDAEVSLAWLFLPILVMIQFVLIGSLALFVAAIVPLLPDLRLIIDNGLMLLFFMSGIFFDISRVPESLSLLLNLNPMAPLIGAYRSILLNGMLPDFSQLFGVVLFSGVASLCALWLLRRYNHIYPKIV